jgi:hypothetical protein
VHPAVGHAAAGASTTAHEQWGPNFCQHFIVRTCLADGLTIMHCCVSSSGVLSGVQARTGASTASADVSGHTYMHPCLSMALLPCISPLQSCNPWKFSYTSTDALHAFNLPTPPNKRPCRGSPPESSPRAPAPFCCCCHNAPPLPQGMQGRPRRGDVHRHSKPHTGEPAVLLGLLGVVGRGLLGRRTLSRFHRAVPARWQ